jgi:hypothetical protein
MKIIYNHGTRIIKCRCRQRRRHLGKWRQGSMNTPFCELKGSYHGSPRHHNANYHKNCVEFKTGDENINFVQFLKRLFDLDHSFRNYNHHSHSLML